jgi:sulfur relay (sulfurtransferase) DsrF/TusC family protein
VQHRKLPIWMQTIDDVKKTRKTLFKHYDVRDNYIHKIELYSKSLNNKKCISSAYNILKIIKDIKDKSMTL